MVTVHDCSKRRAKRGNAFLEFTLVFAFLVPVFAGMFSIGMTLDKAIEVSNICEDAVLLMVDSVTNPQSGLDLSQTQNQRIIVRAATGLGMSSDSSYDPNSSGNAAVVLSKVVMVGPAECAVGVVPAPMNAPPWNSSNCANYGQYVFAYRVGFGNTSRWTSTFGNPPASIVQSNGKISATNIATNTADVAANFGTNIMTLSASTFALVSEMWADVSYLNLFKTWQQTPVIYSRNIS